MQKAEVAASEASDRGYGLAIGKIGGVEIDAERAPVARQNAGQLVARRGR